MQYITHRRFKDNSINGQVNIPSLSSCEEYDGVIYFCGKQICYSASENAHQYFARNDDGNGVERGRLIQNIQNKLAKRDNEYQNRWNAIWDDKISQRYKRKEYDDFWLWNHEFYNAEIEDLKHIAKLINVKE